jgi:hypothetical protein
MSKAGDEPGIERRGGAALFLMAGAFVDHRGQSAELNQGGWYLAGTTEPGHTMNFNPASPGW